MNTLPRRIPKAHLRHGSQGPEGGNGDDHLDEMLGSAHFTIYISIRKKLKGYLDLKRFVENQDCAIIPIFSDQNSTDTGYETVKIIMKEGSTIPFPVIEYAHRWAHKRNYLHGFFKPFGLSR
jgi:hypothetical protein